MLRADLSSKSARAALNGAPAWSEHQWLGRSFAVGAARLTPTKLIDRCNATKADPQTGERDLDVIGALMRSYGHLDLGFYAKVTVGGTVNVGDSIEEVA